MDETVQNRTVNTTEADIYKAFKKWYKDALERPEEFISHEESSAEEFARDCTDYLIDNL